MFDAGLTRISSFDAADPEVFFAAALEVELDRLHADLGNHKDHADPEIEGLEEFVGFDFAEFGEVFEDGRDRPGGEVDLRLHTGGQDPGQVAGDSAAGDMGQRGDPAAREDIFQ